MTLAGILISVPLTLHYLGSERYGLWMTISSLLLLLSFSDLGLGVGLMNLIAHSQGREDREGESGYISTAFFLLLGVCGLVLMAVSSVVPLIPWVRLLNVRSPQAVAEAGPSVLALVACIAIGLPLSVVQRVQLGYQEGGLSNLCNCVGSLFGLLGLLVAIRLHAGLPWLVVGSTGAPLLAQSINHLVYFGIQKPHLRPRLALVRIDKGQHLLRLSIEFFLLQVCYLMSYCMDNFIISLTLGNDSVASYSVCLKYFSLSLALVQMANFSLWTAYGEAFARGDRDWLEQTFWRALKGSLLVSGALTLVLIAISPHALRIWVGPSSIPSFGILCGVGAWGVLDMVRFTTSTFLNAVNILRFQSILFFSFAVAGSTIKVIGSLLFGLEGMVWGGIAAYLIIMLLPMLQQARRMLSEPAR